MKSYKNKQLTFLIKRRPIIKINFYVIPNVLLAFYSTLYFLFLFQFLNHYSWTKTHLSITQPSYVSSSLNSFVYNCFLFFKEVEIVFITTFIIELILDYHREIFMGK